MIFPTPGPTCIHIPSTLKGATLEAQSIMLKEVGVRLPPAFKGKTPPPQKRAKAISHLLMPYGILGRVFLQNKLRKMQPYWPIDKRSWDPVRCTNLSQEQCTTMAVWALKLGVMVHTCNPRSVLRRLRLDPISEIPKQERPV